MRWTWPVVLLLAGAVSGQELPEADGYRGIWYMNQPTKDEHKYKYSGGFATYPQQHSPIAIHEPRANKTFFVYGGASAGGESLLHMVSYYDHATGMVPRPRVLLDKKTTDAHDNPVLSIDGAGHLWVFSNAHGAGRPAYISRSKKPFDIREFERVEESNFSYGQPWHLGDEGFLFLHTRYQGGRRILFSTASRDGREWTEPAEFAGAELGHYMVSQPRPGGGGAGAMFNVHPRPGGLNARTNLYYVETADLGASWKNVAGRPVETPVRAIESPAMVKDYRAEELLVYLKDLQYDGEGRPILLYLTSKGFEPGPRNGPRVWRTARWTGGEWEIREVGASDHNYDYGSLYVVGDGHWKLIAPMGPGPQPDSTGGEIELWETRDAGARWEKVRELTSGSNWNHTYVRRPLNYHPGLAAFWADGDALEPSGSRLYFADLEGERVLRLPERMEGAEEEPWRMGGGL